MINRPHVDAGGRFIHYCAAPGCSKWGAFGYKYNVWVCGAHRAEHERLVRDAETQAKKPMQERQGRLL